MNNDIENFKKRLIYRSQYRGTKEMDKLIGSFVQKNINYFNITQLKELEKFLSIDDDTLYKYYNNQIETIKDIDNDFIKLYKSYIFEKK
jgi:antitoxin CptB